MQTGRRTYLFTSYSHDNRCIKLASVLDFLDGIAYIEVAAGLVRGNMTRGPIRSARVLSLTGAVVPDTRCPPTLVGTTRDHDPDGLRGI